MLVLGVGVEHDELPHLICQGLAQLVVGREGALGLKPPLAPQVVVYQANLVEVDHHHVAARQHMVRTDVDGKGRFVGFCIRVYDDNIRFVQVRRVVDELGPLHPLVVFQDGMTAERIDDFAVRVQQSVDLEVEAGQHGGLLLILPDALVLHVSVALIEGAVAVQHDPAEFHLVVGDIGVKAGDARQNDFAAAAEAVEGVGRDGAQADFEIRSGKLMVDKHLDAMGGDAHVVEIEKAVVVVDGVFPANILSQLFHEIVKLACSVTAQGAQEDDLVLGHAGFKQIVQHDVRHLLNGRRTGIVIEDDAGGFLAFGHFVKGFTADGRVNFRLQFLIAQSGIGIALHHGKAGVPIVRDVDLNRRVPIPSVLRQQ